MCVVVMGISIKGSGNRTLFNCADYGVLMYIMDVYIGDISFCCTAVLVRACFVLLALSEPLCALKPIR